jgi:serine/threonine-protein kinase
MAGADLHPDSAVLEAFTLGTLDDASLAAVEAHLAGCPTCQERAAGASGDNLVALLRRAHARPLPPQAQAESYQRAGQASRAIHGPTGEAAMRIILTVTAGPHLGDRFEFTQHSTFLVGRCRHAQFHLKKDRYLSRVHFLVEVNPPCCRLVDMGSHNHTYVNGVKVHQADLRDGDRIKAGRTLLLVAIENDQPPPGRPTAAPGPLSAGRPEQQAPPDFATAPAQRPREGPPAVAARLPATVAQVPPPSQDTPPTGPGAQVQPVPGYRIVRELGRGAMGVVYLAQRLADGTAVALKTITPAVSGTPNLLARFLREASILRELVHPHIVTFQEMGQTDDLLWFAMDYVPGTDAGHFLEQHGPTPVGRAVGWICQVLLALEYAHGRGFVHRDIKPANVLITDVGGGEAVKLADFGLARHYHDSKLSGLTLTGSVGGTIAFMAPEQITHFREAKPPSDQYSAAATLYNLLTGCYVYDFPPRSQGRLALILGKPPVPLRQRRPDLPEELAAVIHRALARDPAERFSDAGQMRQALRRFRS